MLDLHSIGPSRPTDASHVFTSDGSPPLRMVYDEVSAPDRLEWAYVLHPHGVEVIALTQGTQGPVVGWDSDPLISYSDEPRLWRRSSLPLPDPGPKAPGLTATRPPAAGPTSAQQPTAHR